MEPLGKLAGTAGHGAPCDGAPRSRPAAFRTLPALAGIVYQPWPDAADDALPVNERQAQCVSTLSAGSPSACADGLASS